MIKSYISKQTLMENATRRQITFMPSAADTLQVIYSLNMKNEEQEAALEALSYAHHEELHRILMETCHEGEGSALRTRLLDLQESLEEQHRVGAQVCVCVSTRSLIN